MHLPKIGLREVALETAAVHLDCEPLTTLIVFYPTDEDEKAQLRLLEVIEGIPSSPTIDPVTIVKCRPSHDMPYPCSFIFISPEDYVQLKSGEKAFPEYWGRLEDGEVLYSRNPPVLKFKKWEDRRNEEDQ